MKQFIKNIYYPILIIGSTFCFNNFTNAQSTQINTDHLVSLSLSCPNNPQCIYSNQNIFSIQMIIKNNSDINLEIPFEIIIPTTTTLYFTKLKTEKPIGDFVHRYMGLPETIIKQSLEILPAHSYKILEFSWDKKSIKKAFKQAHAYSIKYHVYMDIPIYFPGSEKPIGYYKDNKFNTKTYTLNATIPIIKDKGN